MATSTAQRKITDDTIASARATHSYIDANGKSNKKSILGAKNHFAKHPEDVYVCDYHVVGTPDAVRSMLVASGLPESEANRAIAAGYTSSNFQTTMKAQFEAELASRMAFNQSNPKKKSKDTGANFVHLREIPGVLQGIKNADKAKKTPRGSKPAKAKKSPKKPGVRQTIDKRISGLKPGKVLDVSNMTEDGDKVKPIDVPGEKSKKYGVEGLQIVSSNFENFERAVNSLPDDKYPNKAQYIEAYRNHRSDKGGLTVAARSAPAAVSAPAPSVKAPLGVAPKPVGMVRRTTPGK